MCGLIDLKINDNSVNIIFFLQKSINPHIKRQKLYIIVIAIKKNPLTKAVFSRSVWSNMYYSYIFPSFNHLLNVNEWVATGTRKNRKVIIYGKSGGKPFP